MNVTHVESQKKYLLSHPWAKHWYWSKSRTKKSKREHTLKISDFKDLWVRDKAWLLQRPSIDRIDNSKGYVEGNCRFIELILNIRLGNLGKQVSDKSRRAAAVNMKINGLKRWPLKAPETLKETP